MKKTIILLSIVLIFVFSFYACTKTEGKKGEADTEKAHTTEEAKSDDKQEEDKREEAVPVKVGKITKGDISSYQLYNATIEAENTVDIYAKVSGIIVELNVEEGEYVKENQVLARIEDEDYKLEEAAARSSYEKTKREFERSEKMYKDNLLSDNDYEQVKYNYEQAKIAWQRAKVRLSHTKITTPISGQVSHRFIKYGDFINVNAKVFSVVDMDSLITKIFIPEKNIANIEIGQTARITSEAMQGKEFKGKIKMISPVVDPDTGTIKVTVDLRGYGDRLKPGMFVKCHVITDTHHDTLLVTKKAVIFKGIQSIIFTVEDGIAHKKVLDVGFQDSEYVEVLNKDLNKDDKIIIVGQYGLKDKTRVKIINGDQV